MPIQPRVREGEQHTGSPGPVESAPTRQRGWAAFVAVAFTLFTLMVGPNVPTPLYPTYERVFGFSPLVMTVIFAVYAIVLIPALLVFGPLSDAVGRRRVLLPAVVLTAIGSLLFALASGPGLLFLARAAQGLGLGAAQGTASAALTDLDPDGNRARAAMIGSVCVVGGIAAGPLLGGVLAQYVPGPLVVPHVVEIVLLVAGFVLLLALVPRASGGAAGWRPSRPSVPASIRRRFTLAGVSAFLAFSVSALFLTLMPSYVGQVAGTRNLALAGGIVALMLGCAAAVQAPVRRISSVLGQSSGLALLAVGLAGVIGAAQTTSLAVVLAATVVTGVGLGLAFGGSLAAVNAVAPEDRRGDILSSYYVTVYVGLALPIIGVGVIALAVGQLVAVQIFAAVIIVLCLLGLTAQLLDARSQRGAAAS